MYIYKFIAAIVYIYKLICPLCKFDHFLLYTHIGVIALSYIITHQEKFMIQINLSLIKIELYNNCKFLLFCNPLFLL